MSGYPSLLRCGQCDIRCREADDVTLRSIAFQGGRGLDYIQVCPRDVAGDPLDNGVTPNAFRQLQRYNKLQDKQERLAAVAAKAIC